MTRARSVTAACVVAVCLTGCAGGELATTGTLPPMIAPRDMAAGKVLSQQAAPPASVPAAVVTSRDLTGLGPYPTMLWLLAASGLLDEIGDRPVTILAPSENAFRDFSVADQFGLMANPAALAPILRRHVILGAYDAVDLVAAGAVTDLAGDQLAVWLNGLMIKVNEITVTPPASDVTAVAGTPVADIVVYEADRLLQVPGGNG
jgi:uncharacterized surface protein with fasciclin (FAS1) repeats